MLVTIILCTYRYLYWDIRSKTSKNYETEWYMYEYLFCWIYKKQFMSAFSSASSYAGVLTEKTRTIQRLFVVTKETIHLTHPTSNPVIVFALLQLISQFELTSIRPFSSNTLTFTHLQALVN